MSRAGYGCLALLLCAACSEQAPPGAADGTYTVSCQEPIPEFRLSAPESPSAAEIEALCRCIWELMSDWERNTAIAYVEGRDADIPEADRRSFPARFSGRVRECAGMGL